MIEALSARLDGEKPPPGLEGALGAAAVLAHLEACETCRSLDAGLSALARSMRVRVLEPAPDLTGTIRCAISALRPDPLRTRLRRLVGLVTGSPRLRLASALLVALPVAIGAPELALGVLAHAHAPAHVVVTAHSAPCTSLLAHRLELVRAAPHRASG